MHLLTDVEWLKLSKAKKENSLHKEGMNQDRKFILTIKKDWYGLDFIYLENNPDCLFYAVFKDIVSVPNYLDYFPENAFQIQVKYITECYLRENKETKENFIYLSQREMDDFVIGATEAILMTLRNCI